LQDRWSGPRSHSFLASAALEFGAAGTDLLEGSIMRKLTLVMAAAVSLLGSSALVGAAHAAPAAQLIPGVYDPSAPPALDRVLYVWGGHRYCWYDGGWHGPGYYWCGYRWRSGYGWGGGYGWRGWVGGHPYGYYRGGPGFHGGRLGFHGGGGHGGGHHGAGGHGGRHGGEHPH
jgi:hypothetical protein